MSDAIRRRYSSGAYPLVVNWFVLLINFCYKISIYEYIALQCKNNAALQYFDRKGNDFRIPCDK